jgi:hypothetical protein
VSSVLLFVVLLVVPVVVLLWVSPFARLEPLVMPVEPVDDVERDVPDVDVPDVDVPDVLPLVPVPLL